MAIEQTPALSEKLFMRQVTDLAEMRGWLWMHIPTAQVQGEGHRRYYATKVDGPLGKGWPDLFLCRGDEMIFIELKAQGGKASPDQEKVLGILGQFGFARVYDPSDWDLIEQVLR